MNCLSDKRREVKMETVSSRLWIFVLLTLSFCLPGYSQADVSRTIGEIGLRGGFTFEDSYKPPIANPRRTSIPSHGTVGPTLRIHLTERLAMQIDALYTRFGWDDLGVAPEALPPGSHNLHRSVRGRSWDVPILGSLETGSRVRTFFGGGIAFHRDSATFSYSIEPPTGVFDTGSSSYTDRFRKPISPVFNVGTRLKLGPFFVVPELRYMRVITSRGTFRDSPEVIRTPNRFNVLLGVTYPFH
jgi:hypothetical protein